MTWLTVLAWLRRVPAWAWAALGLAMCLLVMRAHWISVGERREEARTQAVQLLLDTALEANKSNMGTIDALKRANDELANGREADKEAAEESIAVLAKQRDQLQSDLAKAKRNRSRIYANNPEAAAVGATVVPDSLVDSLRDNAD